MKKYLFFVLLAIVAVLIASKMSYEQQTIVPQLRTILHNEPFKEQLSHIEIEYWHETISVETRGYFYFVEFLIRKATHFSGYGIVGLIFLFFYHKIRLRYAPIFAVASVFLLGCVDEYRQAHIPGRTGLFKDVLIDTSGAILFVGIAMIITAIVHRLKRK